MESTWSFIIQYPTPSISPKTVGHIGHSLQLHFHINLVTLAGHNSEKQTQHKGHEKPTNRFQDSRKVFSPSSYMSTFFIYICPNVKG